MTTYTPPALTVPTELVLTRWERLSTGAELPERDALRVQRQIIASRLAELRKAYRRHIDWHIAITDHIDADADYPATRAPSKAAKHKMYGAAGDLVSACGWDRHEVRAHTLPQIGQLILAVEVLLSGVERAR